jgi:AraC family transcriptional regulator, arabinose operon regulatory protein
MPGPITVPSRLLCHQNVSRTLPGGRDVRVAVGFMLKSGRIVDHAMHRPTGYSAVWCLRGTGTYHGEDGSVHPLSPGSLFHRFSDRAHENRLDPGSHWAEAWLVLPVEIEAALRTVGVLDARRPVQQPGIDLGILREMHQLMEVIRLAPESGLSRVLARVIDVLTQLLDRDIAGNDPHHSAIDEACRRLGDDPRQDLEGLAASLDLSYERFRKIFRERLGVSPGEYRIRRRIDRARALLTQRELSVSGIAELLGYPNPFAFSAQFKQVVGESPERYRKRH